MADIREIAAASFTVDVTLITTAETLIIASPPLALQADVQRVVIMAWAQLATVAATTTVTPRVRRGIGITGALVGEANAEAIKAAAASTEPFIIMVVDTVVSGDAPQWSFTLQTAGSATNPTALQGTIIVFAL